MNTLRVVRILTVLAMLEITVIYAGISGSVVVNGITCEYYEVGKPGPGKRGLTLHGCKDGNGNKMQITCTYYGANPHSCGHKYNKNHKNHQNYYNALATSAMANADPRPCNKSIITENICYLNYPCTDGACPKPPILLNVQNASSAPFSTAAVFIDLLSIFIVKSLY